MILLREKTGVSYKKHSVQINLHEQTSEKDFFFERLQRLVPEDALYLEQPRARTSGNPWEIVPGQKIEEYGREDEPHITVLYGLTNANDLFKITAYLRTVDPFEVELNDISLFENDPRYDVVKVDILSPELHEVYGWIADNCECKLTYPEYRPHTTIAYIQKGSIVSMPNPERGKQIFVRSMEFSHTDGSKIKMLMRSKR